jgi:hypothetical protein
MAHPAVKLPQHGHTVFYAYTINVNGKDVGSIQKLSPKHTRESYRVGEINYERGIEWREILWGYENITLDLSHIEFYKTSLLQAIGGLSTVVALAKMNFSFVINEFQYGQVASNTSGSTDKQGTQPTTDATLLRTITYLNCVPTSYTKTIDRGTIHVMEEMTVECRRAIKGTGATPAAATTP